MGKDWDRCICGHIVLDHDDDGICRAVLVKENGQPYCGCQEYEHG